jgi:Mannosyl-glycoprotein endo-beta-N-acetylglucosaminidase/LysM domain
MKKIIILVFIFCSIYANAQKITPEEYINTFKEIAVSEMKRSGVPASVTLAQGILETECGNSDLVKRSNNHFGIKCKSDWAGESVRHTDDAPNECFRKYPKPEDSYKDHSDYLKTNDRYASLFELAPSDYKGWAYGLKKAGYATNPRYPQIVISHIEKYNLQQYDSLLLATIPSGKIVTVFDEAPQAINNLGKPLDGYMEITEGINNFTKINDLKAIYVSGGTSLLAVANIAKIDLAKLLSFNELVNDGLLQGDQIIYLERKNKKASFNFYTTSTMETLHAIAQKNGVQIKYLIKYNELSDTTDIIPAGTKLKLRQ